MNEKILPIILLLTYITVTINEESHINIDSYLTYLYPSYAAKVHCDCVLLILANRPTCK